MTYEKLSKQIEQLSYRDKLKLQGLSKILEIRIFPSKDYDAI